MERTDWHAASSDVKWNVRSLIDGKRGGERQEGRYNHVNPATGAALYSASVGSAREVDEAVGSARERFERGSWSMLTPSRRAAVLLKLSELVADNKESIALLDSLEMGKPIAFALHDAERAATVLYQWAGLADKLTGDAAPLARCSVSMNVYQPRGVVGAITPWNFPSLNAVRKLGPALAAGNCVVHKPSEVAPSSALRLGELALEAGIPEGVLNVIPGLGDITGAALAAHPDVDLISFTGSTVSGRKVMESAGRSNGKPIMLECGGKSPHVVFGDVENLERVAEEVAQAVLLNQGQVCTAHTRLIVHESIHSRLLERVIERVGRYRVGDPLEEETTFGPLASPGQRDRVRGYIQQGLTEGARVAWRGVVPEGSGCYVEPTIFDAVRESMTIVRDEIFGPVLCLQKFASEEEAIVLANGTPYGLMATIWTGNLGCGMRCANGIRAGAVSIRTSGEENLDQPFVLSFEPQKASGFGSEIGVKGLASYSTLKWVSWSGG